MVFSMELMIPISCIERSLLGPLYGIFGVFTVCLTTYPATARGSFSKAVPQASYFFSRWMASKAQRVTHTLQPSFRAAYFFTGGTSMVRSLRGKVQQGWI